MTIAPRAVAGIGLLLALAAPAQASSGQIDNFGASSTQVVEGSWVDFSAAYSVITSAWSSGGNDMVEPAAQEGYQSWVLSWYSAESETLGQVWLEAGGQSFTDFPSVPAGSSQAGSWSFSLYFPTAGLYAITLGGGWSGQVEQTSSSETLSRDCWNNDPGGTNELVCTSWAYNLADSSYNSSFGGGFDARSLTIEVLPTAVVPEPGTVALWLFGLAGLAAMGAARRGLSGLLVARA
jgi:hypothetical protein